MLYHLSKIHAVFSISALQIVEISNTPNDCLITWMLFWLLPKDWCCFAKFDSNFLSKNWDDVYLWLSHCHCFLFIRIVGNYLNVSNVYWRVISIKVMPSLRNCLDVGVIILWLLKHLRCDFGFVFVKLRLNAHTISIVNFTWKWNSIGFCWTWSGNRTDTFPFYEWAGWWGDKGKVFEVNIIVRIHRINYIFVQSRVEKTSFQLKRSFTQKCTQLTMLTCIYAH